MGSNIFGHLCLITLGRLNFFSYLFKTASCNFPKQVHFTMLIPSHTQFTTRKPAYTDDEGCTGTDFECFDCLFSCIKFCPKSEHFRCLKDYLHHVINSLTWFHYLFNLFCKCGRESHQLLTFPLCKIIIIIT